MESLTHENQSAERQSPRAQRGSNVPGVSVPVPDYLTTSQGGREWPGEWHGEGKRVAWGREGSVLVKAREWPGEGKGVAW